MLDILQQAHTNWYYTMTAETNNKMRCLHLSKATNHMPAHGLIAGSLEYIVPMSSTSVSDSLLSASACRQALYRSCELRLESDDCMSIPCRQLSLRFFQGWMITPCTLQKHGIATPQMYIKYMCITAMADNDNTNRVTCNNSESDTFEHLPLGRGGLHSSFVVVAFQQAHILQAHQLVTLRRSRPAECIQWNNKQGWNRS